MRRTADGSTATCSPPRTSGASGSTIPISWTSSPPRRLQAAADELATRWKWAEARLDVDWSDLARFGRINPQPAQPTDEEKAESERLRTRHDELADMDDDTWTEELVAEGDANETRLEEIDAAVEARATFQPEDTAIAGCIATVGRDGKLQVVQGLVRPEDMPARDERDANAAGQDDDGNDEAGIPGIQSPTISAPAMPPASSDAEAEARKEAGVGIGLGDDLRSIRTALVKARLAEDFGAAFDLVLFQMGRAVFTSGYHAHALDIAVRETPDRPPLRANDDAFAAMSPGEAMLADRSSLPFDWLTMEDDGEAFAALRALPEAGKQSLFAACAARTVKGQLAFEHGARPGTGGDRRPARHRLRHPCPADARSCSGRACARTGCWPSPATRSAWNGRLPTARTRRPHWRRRWKAPSLAAKVCL